MATEDPETLKIKLLGEYTKKANEHNELQRVLKACIYSNSSFFNCFILIFSTQQD